MSKAISRNEFSAEVLEAQGLVLVDFYATWCPPCQVLLPVLEQLSQLDLDLKICKVNTDEESELASQYGIMSLPTLKLFKGGEVIAERLGAADLDELTQWIKDHQ